MAAGSGRRENLRRALAAVADDVPWARLERVIVKPNFVSLSNPASSTHPDAVDELLGFVRERFDGPVWLIEGGAGHRRLAGFERFGYEPIAERYDVSLEEIGEGASRDLTVFDHRFRPHVVQADERILDSTFTISVTPPKMHDTVVFTGALKNLIMGTLLVSRVTPLRQGRRTMRRAHKVARVAWHTFWPRVSGGLPRRFKNTRAYCDVDFTLLRTFCQGDSRMSMHQSFAAMNLNLFAVTPAIHPHLSVIDAFEVMGGDGPVFGYPVETNVAIVSEDYVAADATAARLMGLAAEDVGYLVYCAHAGYGHLDPAEIELIGDDIGAYRRTIERHTTYDQQVQWRSETAWREVERLANVRPAA